MSSSLIQLTECYLILCIDILKILLLTIHSQVNCCCMIINKHTLSKILKENILRNVCIKFDAISWKHLYSQLGYLGLLAWSHCLAIRGVCMIYRNTCIEMLYIEYDV